MNIIALQKPEITERTATFRWSVEPDAGLNPRRSFSIIFPAEIDLAGIPESVWWRVAIVCLHSQWPLLRPCRVILPVRLARGEAEAWTRLIESEIVSLEHHFGSRGMPRRIEIEEHGPEMPPAPPPAAAGRPEGCVMAFSGGKDSMVQLALLRELGVEPLLLTITSLIPWAEDQNTRRRYEVFDEIRRRTGYRLLEVTSDYRSNFKPHVAPSIGVDVPANPITDTFLYFAALLVVGYALGIPHLLLASEAEIQNTARIGEDIVQFMDYMYSAATQSSLQAIFESTGIFYSSLVSPLHRYQLQTMLWTRYDFLADLQYSCYKVRKGQMMCNQCIKCMVLAFRTLAAGGEASRMGVRWPKLLIRMCGWKPKPAAATSGDRLPRDIHFTELDAQIARDIEAVSWKRMARTILRESPLSLLYGSGLLALSIYPILRKRAIARRAGKPPGYKPEYLKYVDPVFREGVGGIFAELWAPSPIEEYRGNVERIDALIERITEPLRTDGKPQDHNPSG